VVGDYSIPVKDTWQVRLDRMGRGGIIAELNATDKFEVVQNAPIWFTMNMTVNRFNSMNSEGGNLVLQIVYLKSYSNAGQVVIDLCGKEFFGGTISALWDDYKTYHYTVPEIYSKTIENCAQDGNEKIRVGLKHWINPENLNTNDMKSIIEKSPRTRQLFKIISVMACRFR
jgi:hypothetical protein